MRARILLSILALLCAVSLCALAAILVCAKCGYENNPGSKFCNHCGAVVAGGSEDNSAVGGSAAASGQSVVIPAPIIASAAIVEGELKAASAQLSGQNGWLALFYCENAMALNAIATTPEGFAGRVLKIREKCEAGVRLSVRRCRACSGTGAIIRLNSSQDSFQGDDSVKAVCTFCQGTGIAPGRVGLDVLKHGYDAAMNMYDVLRTAAKWVPVGTAWIPPELDGKLNNMQVAALKRVTGVRCSDCAGTGQTTCSKCDGTGGPRCPNRACSNGFISKKLEGGLGGASASPRVMMVRCPDCGGRGTTRCSVCDGCGSLTCKTCKGRGKPAICGRCDGSGLRTCSDCSGTGKKKSAVCVTCRGCGSILCKSCMGSGRDK